MRHRGAFIRLLGAAVALAVFSGVAAIPAEAAAPSAAAPATPVMRAARVSSADIAAWFAARNPGGYRATVPVGELISTFLDEGGAQGVAGDIAFAQSVLE